MLHLLPTLKTAFLKGRLAWTRQITKLLQEGKGRVDASRKRIEDEMKKVKNQLRNKKRQEQTPIEDVEKKRRELDTLMEARKKEEEQAENQIRKAWEKGT